MSENEIKLAIAGVQTLLHELFNGPVAKGTTWVLNPHDQGLLDTLGSISAGEASRVLIPGRSTLAGHANHLRYSFELVNRWGKGEDAYENADWEGSWRPQEVSDEEWIELRRSLAVEIAAAAAMFEAPRRWDARSLTGAIASAAHAAYHFGAIRQLVGLLPPQRT